MPAAVSGFPVFLQTTINDSVAEQSNHRFPHRRVIQLSPSKYFEQRFLPRFEAGKDP
jgi:hypothetical protein